MSRKSISWMWVVGLVVVLAAAGSIGAGDKAKTAASAEHADPQQKMQEEMAAWVKFAAPGEHHEHLAKMVGQWKARGVFWMQPGAPPMESLGSADISPILGGRFLQIDYKADFMGSPFVGMGLEGFDNFRQKHIGMWIDSMGTMMATFEGSCSQDGTVTTTYSTFKDPNTGTDKKTKFVTRLIDDDHFTHTSYDLGAEGEFKTMVIEYTRM